MPVRLDQVSSNFSEGSKDLVLEGRIPERGQGNQISVQLKDAYGMVALSIKADLPSMMLEIGNNYVVQLFRIQIEISPFDSEVVRSCILVGSSRRVELTQPPSILY